MAVKGNTKSNRTAKTEKPKTGSAKRGKQISIEEEMQRRGTEQATAAESVWKWLRQTFLGRFVLLTILIIVWIGLLLLFTGNRFDQFFLWLGISTILVILTAWVVHLVRSRKEMEDDSVN